MESLARPVVHRRKHSNAGAYDDVFSGVGRVAASATKSKFGGCPTSGLVAEEDYNEIFGGGRRGGSSIPVLDLSELDGGESDFRNSKVDYSSIFGGFGEFEDVAVPYEELLFDTNNYKAAKKKSKFSAKAKMRSPGEMTAPFPRSGDLAPPKSNNEFSSEAPKQTIDGLKQVSMSYHKTTQRNKDGPDGMTHVAQLHAVPGFTYFVDEAGRMQKTDVDKPVSSERIEAHDGKFGDDTSGRKQVSEMEARASRKQTSEAVANNKEGSCPDIKPFNAQESNVKSQSFKVPSFFGLPVDPTDNRGHPKRSKSANFLFKPDGSERTSDGCSPSFFDEEIDENSPAGASAAALKRAIEEAQETIRIAKEIMERRKGNLRGVSKPRTKSSLEVEDMQEDVINHEVNSFREKSTQEVHERLNPKAFTIMDQSSASRSSESVSVFNHSGEIPSNGELKVQKHGEKFESTEERESASWFPGLLNSGKRKLANLASGLADMKNNIVLSMDKHLSDSKDMRAVNENLRQGEATIKKIEAPEQVTHLDDTEGKEALERPKELQEKLDNLDSVKTMHQDSAPQCSNEQNKDVMHELGECMNKLEDCQDLNEKIAKSNFVEDQCKEIECQELGNEQEQLEDFELHQTEKRGSIKGQEKTNFRLWKTCNEEEIKTCQKEDCDLSEHGGEPEGASVGESTETNLREFQVREDLGKQVDSVIETQIDDNQPGLADSELNRERSPEECEQEQIQKKSTIEYEYEATDTRVAEADKNMDNCISSDSSVKNLVDSEGECSSKRLDVEHCSEGDDKLTHAHDGEESKERPKAENDWEEIDYRIKGTYNVERIEDVKTEGDDNSGNRHPEAAQEVEEIDKTQRESDKTEETNETVGDQEAVERNSVDAGSNIYGSTSDTDESLKPSLFEVNDNDIKACRFSAFEHYESTSAGAEAFCELEQEQDVKVKFGIEEKEMPDISNVQIPSEEMVTESDTEDDPGASLIDSDTNSNFTTPHFEESMQSEKDVGTLDKLSKTAAKESITEKMPEVPEVHHCNEKALAFDFVEVDLRQKHFEDDDKASEITSASVNDDNLSPHESGVDMENVKEDEIAFAPAEQEVNSGMTEEQIKPIDIPTEWCTSETSTESKRSEESLEGNANIKSSNHVEKDEENLSDNSSKENEARETAQREVEERVQLRNIEMEKEEREREKNRMAVERAIREARERAFAEARERAERAAVERANAEVRQRVMAEAREKLGKTSTGSKVSTDKTSTEAKLRAERAAVERATAEARARALEKALSQKTSTEVRTQAERAEKVDGAPRDNGLKHSFSSSDLERFDGTNSESAQRRKARLERHHRIMERAAKALAEKNMRDLLAQKEQAERNRLAEALDADIKRWASGKEGNLRALLSTLQYILGPNSGWQPISLTEIITTSAVRKAYRKATLYVHPDKLQQRGASIQQKYICEKVFDLLKAAWNKFNSEER